MGIDHGWGRCCVHSSQWYQYMRMTGDGRNASKRQQLIGEREEWILWWNEIGICCDKGTRCASIGKWLLMKMILGCSERVYANPVNAIPGSLTTINTHLRRWNDHNRMGREYNVNQYKQFMIKCEYNYWWIDLNLVGELPRPNQQIQKQELPPQSITNCSSQFHSGFQTALGIARTGILWLGILD